MTAGAPGHYVSLSRPRAATVDVRRPGPASFHVELTARALNHGMPAAASFAPLRTRIARAPLPTRTAVRVVRRLSGDADDDLDAVRHLLVEAWPELVQQCPRLARGATGSASYDDLSLLTVRRSGGRTAFVFHGDDLEPCLILASAESEGRRTESRAQAQAAELGVAPLPLGQVGRWLVQEGVGGMPLWIDAARDGLTWPEATLGVVDQIHDKLTTLARGTARQGASPRVAQVFASASRVPIDPHTRDRLDRIQRDLTRLDLQVLEHGDVSAQNVTVADHGRVTGIVDWEFARADGVLGLDQLNVAFSLAEHARARYAWSDEESYRLALHGWDSAPIFTRARQALRDSLEATVGSVDLAEQLEVAAALDRLTGWARSGASPMVGRTALLRTLRHIMG